MKKHCYFTLLLAMILSAGALVLTSCSDKDDENAADKKAREIYDWNLKRLMADDGSINLYADDVTEGLYYLPAENLEESHTICEHIIGTSWDGTPTTISLGELGTISIATSDKSGTFHTVNYNLAGVGSLTMIIAPLQYIENDNSTISRPSHGGEFLW